MESLEIFIRTYGYPALFGGMVMEQFVPPLPGEPLLLGAGALAGTGHFRLWFAAALALAGTVVGDLVWYEIGRRGGHRVLKRLCRLSIEPDTCVRRGAGHLCAPRRERALDREVPAGTQQHRAAPRGGARHAETALRDLRRAWGRALGGTICRFGLRSPRSARRGCRPRRPPGRLGHRDSRRAPSALYLGVKVTRRQLFLRQLRIARISPEELEAKLTAGEPVFIVDLRHELDVQAEPAMIRGAVHLAPPRSSKRHAAIPRDREVVLYCS